MHYSTLLQAFRTDRDLKRSGLTTVLAGYNLEEIEEELEYTMMAGWVVENNNGITLSLKWRDLDDDQKRAYLERKDRPELTDPIDIGMLTGVLIRRDYAWTKLNWHTFTYSLLGRLGADGETPVTLITGLFQGEAWLELNDVKAAIERAVTQWYRTSEGTKAWNIYNYGLNVWQLVKYAETSYHLEPILQSYGVQNLKITRSLSNSSWQENSLLGTRAPDPVAVSTSHTGANIYVVLDVEDCYIVGAFATLDLAKQAVKDVNYTEEMIDGVLVSAGEGYQIIALPLVTSAEQDQRELFTNEET
jgi:hypothetical protein